MFINLFDAGPVLFVQDIFNPPKELLFIGGIDTVRGFPLADLPDF
jgi:hypothetical protein